VYSRAGELLSQRVIPASGSAIRTTGSAMQRGWTTCVLSPPEGSHIMSGHRRDRATCQPAGRITSLNQNAAPSLCSAPTRGEGDLAVLVALAAGDHIRKLQPGPSSVKRAGRCVIAPTIAHRGAGITAPTKTRAAVPDVTHALPKDRSLLLHGGRGGGGRDSGARIWEFPGQARRAGSD
jgi:hypothetical protein